jgi:hypothetical protein
MRSLGCAARRRVGEHKHDALSIAQRWQSDGALCAWRGTVECVCAPPWTGRASRRVRSDRTPVRLPAPTAALRKAHVKKTSSGDPADPRCATSGSAASAHAIPRPAPRVAPRRPRPCPRACASRERTRSVRREMARAVRVVVRRCPVPAEGLAAFFMATPWSWPHAPRTRTARSSARADDRAGVCRVPRSAGRGRQGRGVSPSRACR